VTAQDGEAARTAAATQARRTGIAAMIQRVGRALQQMQRERAAITSAAVSRRAGVSRSFLYQNTDARALVTAAAAGHAKEADARAGAPAPATSTEPWRERALNAESELKRAHVEIAAQRGRIGELFGRIRDLEHDLPEDGVARTITENHALRAQVRQLTQDNRRLEERLAGARDTNRFLDKRIAELEAELASPQARREAY
jgi:chromosome segregation ATPase